MTGGAQLLRRRLSSFTERRMFASWKLNIIGYMSDAAIKPGFLALHS